MGLLDVYHRLLRPGPSLDPGGSLLFVEILNAGYEKITGMQGVFPLPGPLRRTLNYIY